MFYFRILRPDVTRLLFELRVDQVVVREDLVPLFLREHLLFVDDEFMQGLAGEEAFASDVRAGLVAEVGLENRDDAERAHHEVFAVLGVDNDAVNALFTQSVAGVRQNLHLHIQSEGDDRFHHVQFKLAGGGGKHDGGVETDGEERSLIRHFRDNRIDLARHDRAARLELGQNDFAKAGTRAGGQETQVIADLRELDGEALAGRREGDIGAAVGRGGDQVVVKEGEEVTYYGGKAKQVERNTRVKARVKAHALREIIESREHVVIMGHTISDVDSLGAAIGVYCAARVLGKKAQIVLNEVTTSLRPLVECFTEEKGYPADLFIKNEEALLITNKNTLVMVVDTNRPSYTECPELLNRTDTICVFDHHRQNSEVIENPVLSYIEPYASSACEMIAEVLQYFSENIKLEPSEADCIYAGILIDTNNFMTKTGVRTFEAAAYLRRAGAEVTRVRKMLRNDMAAYKARAEAVRHAEVYRGAFAISVCPADNIESPTIVGAQAANELLNIVGIKASFVLTEYQGKIYISSRSIDEINVQLIMERVGGGGHLNVAGAQLTNCTIQEAKRMIQDTIDEMIKEGDIQE